MMSRFSPVTFAIVFSCTYALVFWFNQPLFMYYPLHGEFTWGAAVKPNSGPAMAWYGLMSDSFIAAGILSLLVPNRMPDKLFRNYLWLFPCAAMLICLWLLRLFFLTS